MRKWNEGDSATITRAVAENDLKQYSALTQVSAPNHPGPENASGIHFGDPTAHGLLAAGLIATLIGTKIPGPGATCTRQTLRFLRPVHPGDTITATVAIVVYDRERGRMVLETVCQNQRREQVLSGHAEIKYLARVVACDQPAPAVGSPRAA